LTFFISMLIIIFMNYTQLINHFQTQQKVAQALGINQSAVSLWHKAGYIPIGRQYQIQVITGGALQADGSKIS
jgi:transcriptional repressor of cell division inhibition gene dicB